MIIEDDDLTAEIMRRRIDAGAPIFDRLTDARYAPRSTCGELRERRQTDIVRGIMAAKTMRSL